MASLTIKDIPPALHEELKRASLAEGRSMNSLVIGLLGTSMEERARRRAMREGREEFRRFLRTLRPMSDSTDLIREDRTRAHR